MKTKATSTKTDKVKLSKTQLELEKTRKLLKETYQQLRSGASTNVRQPAALRKEIARLLTKMRMEDKSEEGKNG